MWPMDLDFLAVCASVQSTMIKTGKVTDRRAIRFGRMEDILRDVHGLNRRVEDGATLRGAGNWTPAQVVDHVAKSIGFSIDGFPADATPPLPLRFIGRMLRTSVLLKPTKAGITLKGKVAAALAPEPNVTWGQAVTRMTNVMSRIQKGERMTASSPMFGRYSHEEWNQFHCRHAELHLSFVQPK